MSRSERGEGAGAALGIVLAFLSLVVAVLQLVHDVYGVGPAPITYIVDKIQDAAGQGPPEPGRVPVPVPKAPTGAFDVEPPTVPQNLRIERAGGSRIGCDVVLAWDASADNTGVRSYHVYANGTFRGIAPGSSSSFAVSVFSGAQENYTVSASDGSNESGQSAPLLVSC